jgi:hypothetical protein
VRWEVDFGDEDDQRHLAEHLAERGLWVGDVEAVAAEAIGRRKGDRMFLFGRGEDGLPVVVVAARASSGWRPVTAWPMSLAERRWWRARGGS